MDGNQFDTTARRIAGSRRVVIASSALLTMAGMLGAVSSPAVTAAKKKKKKKPTKPVAASTYTCADTVENTFSGGPGGIARFSQSFTATRGGTLNEIRVAVVKTDQTGDYVVQLVKMDGAVPSASPLDVLAAATIPDAQVKTGNVTLSAKFAATTLTAGTRYAVVVSRPGSADLVVQVAQGGGDCEGDAGVGQGPGVFSNFINPSSDMLVTVLVV
ncbi:MAG: choice-of-anchor R domain-containing protein [Thermomicrobiales bacterium]